MFFDRNKKKTISFFLTEKKNDLSSAMDCSDLKTSFRITFLLEAVLIACFFFFFFFFFLCLKSCIRHNAVMWAFI